mmetsp:Transcript_40645/g.95790  ORF Transcript_40645/g.95790 Transcript_40645/m.95790 type:complete len:271 (+) Transcript_40645:1302-2114(+)
MGCSSWGCRGSSSVSSRTGARTAALSRRPKCTLSSGSLPTLRATRFQCGRSERCGRGAGPAASSRQAQRSTRRCSRRTSCGRSISSSRAASCALAGTAPWWCIGGSRGRRWSLPASTWASFRHRRGCRWWTCTATSCASPRIRRARRRCCGGCSRGANTPRARRASGGATSARAPRLLVSSLILSTCTRRRQTRRAARSRCRATACAALCRCSRGSCGLSGTTASSLLASLRGTRSGTGWGGICTSSRSSSRSSKSGSSSARPASAPTPR